MTDVGNHTPPQARDTVPLGRVAGYCLAIMSFAAGVIHFGVAAQHFQQYWLFSLSMLVIAWLQVIWAVVVIVRPSRPLLQAGAILNAVVLAGYLITRTTGYAIGIAPHEAGLSAFGAVFCAAFEAVVVAGCGWLLTARAERQNVRRQRLLAVPAATAAMTAVVLATALATAASTTAPTARAASGAGSSAASGSSGTGSNAAGSNAGSAAGSMPGMQMPGGAAASIRLANDTHAGDITMPAMIHVWFVPIPGGPTAIDAPDQQVVQAAQQVPAPANGTA